MVEPSPKRVPDEIKQLVEKHQVCWDVWSEPHYREGQRYSIGYVLRLLGVHDHPEHPPRPGCDECQLVFQHLRRIADWITPEDERDSRYEITMFDSKLRYSPNRRFRAEVTLSLRILHKARWDAPVDACEIRCLHEMELKLRAAGAHKGSLD